MEAEHTHGGKCEIPSIGEGSQTVIDMDHEITDPVFDESELFESEIKALVQKIVNVCAKHQLPFVCGVNFHNDRVKGNGICFVAGLPGARTPMAFRVFTDAMQDPSGNTLKGMMLGAAMTRAAEICRRDGKDE